MSNEEEMLVELSSAQIISVGNPSRSVTRSAHFLLPRADRSRPPALPSPARNGGLVLNDKLHMDFKGWPGSPMLWRPWVAKIRPRHELLWKRLGIFDAILATTRQVRRDEDLLLQLSAFWSRDTSTFVFPWGEATVTLEDVAVLGGLPLLGNPACAVLPDALCGDVDALEAIRRALNRSKGRKAKHSAWARYFLERPPEPEEDAAGDGDRLLEHGAFLAMWLSTYVFPSPPFDLIGARVFPIAVRLARDQRVALAPAALASIYNALSSPSGCAPLQILQLWVWERFQELRPETESSEDPSDDGVPARAVRWHNVRKEFNPRYIRAVFMSPKKFEWMPYGASTFGLPPDNGGRRVHGQDIAGSQELLSMAQCLRPCELVGIDYCIEQYSPHRVARQLGFDQDVPGNVHRVNSDPEAALATYKVEPAALAFIVPHGDPGVTVEYERWWEPHSSAWAADVAEAARRKQLHQRKRRTIWVVGADVAAAAEDDIPPEESLNGEATNEGRQLLSSSIRKDMHRDHGCEILAAARNDSASREEPADISPSNPVKGKTEAVEGVVCTRTLYYLTQFDWKKGGQMSARDTNSDQGFFQPRRKVGTREMIMQACAAREDENAELAKRIESLRKQISGRGL